MGNEYILIIEDPERKIILLLVGKKEGNPVE
jgi:hypothetical protein